MGAAQFGDRVPLDLADALGGDPPHGSDVGQLGLASVQQAVAAPHDVGGPLIQRRQHAVQAGAILGVQHHLVGAGGHLAGQQVTERGIAVLFDRCVKADVVAGQPEQVDHLLLPQPQLVGDLDQLGLAAQPALKGATDGGYLVDLLGDVHRKPDDPALLGDAPGDRLANPPGRVGRELEALGVVELLHRADQAGVAFLNQVQQRHLRPPVLAGDRDDQPQVGGDEPLQRGVTLGRDALQLVGGDLHL